MPTINYCRLSSIAIGGSYVDTIPITSGEYTDNVSLSVPGKIFCTSDYHNEGDIWLGKEVLASSIYTDTGGNIKFKINGTTFVITPTILSYLVNLVGDVNTNLNLKANINNQTFTGVCSVPTASAGTNTTQISSCAFVRNEITNLINSSPSTMDTLKEISDSLGADPNFATTMTTLLASKAGLSTNNIYLGRSQFNGDIVLTGGAFPTTSVPSYTGLGVYWNKNGLGTLGEVSFLCMSGGGAGAYYFYVCSASTAPVLVAQISASGRITASGATFSGTVTAATPTLSTHLATKGYADSLVSGSSILGSNNTFTGTNNFTGTVTGITKSMVGLSSVDNTSDVAKPVSTAQQTALDLKSNIASPTFTGTVFGITKSMVGLGSVDNTTDIGKPVSTAQQTALDLKANLASPTFTGTVSGITKSMVGLSNVDNTSDSAKPVSTAQQTALDLKANLASPTFTGTVSGITKSMVGLSSVDNTTDAGKPISSATQTALDSKAGLASSNTFAGTNNTFQGITQFTNTTVISGGAFPTSTAQTQPYTGLGVFWNRNMGGAVGETTFLSYGGGGTGYFLFYTCSNTSLPVLQASISNTGIISCTGLNFTGNIVAGSSTISATELGYLDNVTSNIQTQINAKLATTTAASTYGALAGTNTWSNTNTYTGNIVANSLTITPTQLGYLSGGTQNINTALTALQTATTNINYNGTDTLFTNTSFFSQLATFNNGLTIPNSKNINLSGGIALPNFGSVVISPAELTHINNLSQNVDTALTGLQDKTTNQSYSTGTTTFSGALSLVTATLSSNLYGVNGVFSGNIENSNPPTTGVHLVNKTYADGLIMTLKAATNTWSAVQTFTSSLVASAGITLPSTGYTVASSQLGYTQTVSGVGSAAGIHAVNAYVYLFAVTIPPGTWLINTCVKYSLSSNPGAITLTLDLSSDASFNLSFGQQQEQVVYIPTGQLPTNCTLTNVTVATFTSGLTIYVNPHSVYTHSATGTFSQTSSSCMYTRIA